MSNGRALVVTPDGEGNGLESALEDAGYRVTMVDRTTTAVARAASGSFDCVITGWANDDGLDFLEAIETVDETVPTIVYEDGESISADAIEAADRFVSRNGTGTHDRLLTEVGTVTSEPFEPPQDISGHEPDPEEIVRAIEDAPIGISLSDASLSDDPLVYINDAWEDITGYDREFTLGRNPRFLQGPATDAETKAAVGNAIANDDPITVEIRNYRRDGTPFWNELTVAPVHDDEGEVAHYVGFQNDVSDRKTAETLAEKRATKLAEERQSLKRLLEHVHGLLNEVTEILFTERERDAIVQQVCEAVGNDEAFPACWFGSTPTTGNTLDLEASTGLPDPVDSPLELTALPDPVEEAIESGDVATCRVRECPGEALNPAAVGARRLAIIPVSYGRKDYGVLGVYGDRGGTLDSREQQLLASIGNMIGSRLNAIDVQRVISADQVIEVEIAITDETFPLSAVASKLGTDVEYVGLTRGKDADTGELFCTTADDTLRDEVTELPFVEDVRTITDSDDGTTFAMTVDSITPFDELAEYGASITELHAHPERAVLTIELPPSYEVRSILDLLEADYEQVALRSRTDRDNQVRTTLDKSSILEERLTDRQLTALEAAHMNGYFEWPRPTDGSAIADTMGITRQTFHQHLRAAERKLVETFVDPASTDGPS